MLFMVVNFRILKSLDTRKGKFIGAITSTVKMKYDIRLLGIFSFICGSSLTQFLIFTYSFLKGEGCFFDFDIKTNLNGNVSRIELLTSKRKDAVLFN